MHLGSGRSFYSFVSALCQQALHCRYGSCLRGGVLQGSPPPGTSTEAAYCDGTARIETLTAAASTTGLVQALQRPQRWTCCKAWA